MDIERLQQSIQAQFLVLETLQQLVTGLSEALQMQGDDESSFLDDLDDQDEVNEDSAADPTVMDPLSSGTHPL